jgi:hypothetical protein
MRKTSWLILVAAATVHLGLLLGWRFQTRLIPYFFDATVLSGGRGLDFYSLYQAGYNARHGLDIYEGDPAKVQIVVPYSTPYRYLPPVAYTIGAALSLLSPLTAFKAWVVIVELTLLLCVGFTLRQTRNDLDLGIRLAAMWLVFTPYYLELFMGQFSFIQAALVFGMLLVAYKPRSGGPLLAVPTASLPARFDVLWVASLLWKINTVLFTPVYLRLRRWRALAAAILLGAALTFPYFLVFPAHWPDLLANNLGQSVRGHELGNLGLRQLVFELLALGGAGPGLQGIAQAAIVVFVLVAALALTFRRQPPQLAGLLALWLTAFFLISPQVWEHHYVMLLPALILAYWQRPGWLTAAFWLLFALPTPFGFTALQPMIAANHDLRAFAIEPASLLILQHASKAVPALLFFIYLGLMISKSPMPIFTPPLPLEPADSTANWNAGSR